MTYGSRRGTHAASQVRASFDIDNLARLRARDHVLQVGILIDGAGRIVALFNFTLSATLLLILLLLFTGLLAAAFFQLAILVTRSSLAFD